MRKTILIGLSLVASITAQAGVYYDAKGHYLGYSVDGGGYDDFYGPGGAHLGTIIRSDNAYDIYGGNNQYRGRIFSIDED